MTPERYALAVVAAIFLAMLLPAVGFVAYAFGWWRRGRRERERHK
jgi:hypothetical protein